MTDAEIRSQILAFSAHLRSDADKDAAASAQRHGWLDTSGEPTAEGRKLVDALVEQDGTRSAFRGSY
jgi:hypothetical protein